MTTPDRLRVAVLDDYADIAAGAADWASLAPVADVDFLHHPVPAGEAARTLAPYDILCTMRERMNLPRELLASLPRLKAITIVGRSIASLDLNDATGLGIAVLHPDFARMGSTPGLGNPTAELTWALVLAASRQLGPMHHRLMQGRWHVPATPVLEGRTLGLLGLGRIGTRVARYGQAFGMDVIAWSQNLTTQAAAEVGVTRVDKQELFERSDVLSIHLVLSERTTGLVGAGELAGMKPSAILVNTARSRIVDQNALVDALSEGRLAGAGLDVFDDEPLPADHPLLGLPTVTLTPHAGYSTPQTLAMMYADWPEAILAYAAGSPIRVLNPESLEHPRHSI